MPAASATALHAGVVEPSTKMVTVAPGSAVPETVGEGEVVEPSAGASTTGEAGAVASTVKVRGIEVAVGPELFAAVATATCGPSPNAGATVHDQLPEASAVVVQAGVVLPSR